VDEDHAYFAAKKAIKAWIERRSVARTLPLEVILYAAATRQINKATTIGIKEGTNDVVIIFLGKEKVDEKKLKIKDFEEKEVLKMNRKKFERIIQFFSINKNELEIVGKEKISLLVRERIVLFDLNK
jgi:KEOPS complex subunit Cgi121